jgi:uncharacterized membrane protein YqhA
VLVVLEGLLLLMRMLVVLPLLLMLLVMCWQLLVMYWQLLMHLYTRTHTVTHCGTKTEKIVATINVNVNSEDDTLPANLLYQCLRS